MKKFFIPNIKNNKPVILIKKFIKILFFNCIFIFFVFFLVEFTFITINYIPEKEVQEMDYKFNNENKKYTFLTHLEKQIYKFSRDITYVDIRDIEDYSFAGNNPETFKKKPIVLVGCSYTYGQHLEDKYAFHNVLAKYTKRFVYNLGVCGGSPREILFILRNNKIINRTIKNKNIDYVIYTYIQDHKHRLYTDITLNTPHFKKTDNGNALKFYKGSSYFYRTYTYRNFTDFIYMNFISSKTKYDLFNLYIKEITKEIKNLFGENTKFVILVYNISEDDIPSFDKLSKEGIIIINLNDLLNIDLYDQAYTISKDDYHPNAKAWEIIVPAIAKELNL